MRLPLTASNLYETHKVNYPSLRALIAETQATLSRSEVFRGRRRRLEIEIGRVLSQIYGLGWVEPDPDWVFSNLFFEAQAELGRSDAQSEIFRPDARSLPTATRRALSSTTWSILTTRPGATPWPVFEEGSERLRADIEERRAQHWDEPLSMPAEDL